MHWDRWALWWNRLRGGGGLGLAILTFGFGVPPDSPPSLSFPLFLLLSHVLLSCRQRRSWSFRDNSWKNTAKEAWCITFLGPAVAYLFTAICGTGYSLFPFILLLLKSQLMQEWGQTRHVNVSHCRQLWSYSEPSSAVVTGTIAVFSGLHVSALDFYWLLYRELFWGVLLVVCLL